MARTVKSKKNFFLATGRRKTAIAKVFLKPGKGNFIINGKAPEQHLGNVVSYINLIKKPLVALKAETKYDVVAQVNGGGLSGQADAIRLGVARALVLLNVENKPVMKEKGLLTRDPREKERKKFGRKKARRRFQRSKR